MSSSTRRDLARALLDPQSGGVADCSYPAWKHKCYYGLKAVALMGSTRTEAAKEETAVAETVKVELATTAAVLLEAKFPYTSPNTFALLSLPAFVEEMEADESKLSSGGGMFSSTAEAKSDGMETVDEEEEKSSSIAATKKSEEDCCDVLCSWLEVDTRRMVAAQALAVVYRAIATESPVDAVAQGAKSLTTPLDEMTKALNNTELSTLLDLDFINALLESIRDIYLFQHKLATSTLENAFKAMSTVMPRLEWGKFLRLRTEAIATVLVGCAESDEFQVGNHPWISDFISFLLDPIVSSENVHSFMILCGLIRAERKLLLHVVSFLDVDVIYATILQLSENAASEGLEAISTVCKQVMVSLGSKQQI
eukprot:jgi/Phyca11/13288/fgenesh1_pg.PHYCAscaffold_3_\